MNKKDARKLYEIAANPDGQLAGTKLAEIADATDEVACYIVNFFESSGLKMPKDDKFETIVTEIFKVACRKNIK